MEEVSSGTPKHCRILVVEDDLGKAEGIIQRAFLQPVNVKELTKRKLEIPKLTKDQVRIALTFERACEELDEASRLSVPELDLVILDLYIPQSSTRPDPEVLYGYEVLRRIREVYEKKLGYHVPVVILSANIKSDVEGGSYGFSFFKDLLKQKQASALPDDFLLKDDAEGISYLDDEQLLRKTAKYLVELTPAEEELLADNGIFLIEGSVSARIIRQLKRHARSSDIGKPLADVLLLGENGVGKTTFARAYDLLRLPPQGNLRLGFVSQDLGSLDMAGSAGSLRLFGGTDFSDGSGRSLGAWTLGAFSQSTCYCRPGQTDGQFLHLPGQVFHSWAGSTFRVAQTAPTSPELNSTFYPDESWTVDFETSGTLFLDEVVNVSEEMQAMLLQALNYNRYNRFVYTTGRTSRRIPVGPAIIMATRKDIDDIARSDADASIALRDFLFRIDQIRVPIPPLRKRKAEVVPYLQRAVQKRRQISAARGLSRGQALPVIAIDKRVKYVLENELAFSNNFADLDRIADQVQPEEESITFCHVLPLYERAIKIEIRSQNPSRHYTAEECMEYLHRIEIKQDPPCSVTGLLDRVDLSPTSVYYIGCMFLYRIGFSVNPKWPTDDELTLMYFNEKVGSFKQSLSRLCKKVENSGDAPLDTISRRIEILVAKQLAPDRAAERDQSKQQSGTSIAPSIG